MSTHQAGARQPVADTVTTGQALEVGNAASVSSSRANVPQCLESAPNISPTSSSQPALPTSSSLPSSNTPPELPSSTMDDRMCQRGRGHGSQSNNTNNHAGGRRCQICNDAASGFHYGVWSCEGCKAFFKRSLQGPVEYVCPATNNCTIDKHRRKSCQACRLRKCIEMGMSRGNCRKERSPRQPKGQKRKAEESEPVITAIAGKVKKEIVYPPDTSCSHGSGDISVSVGMSNSWQSSAVTEDAASIFSSSPPCEPIGSVPVSPVYNNLDNKSNRVGSVSDSEQLPMHPLVSYLMEIDPPPRKVGHDNSKPPTEMILMASLLKLADLEIVDVISWAKAIPGYTDLNLQDRIHMLEASWMEILILGLMWRSMPYHNVLVFAEDIQWGRSMLEKANIWTVCEKMIFLTQLFTQMDVSREEFVLLRATILLNADITELHVSSSGKKIHELQQTIEEAWAHTLKRYRRPSFFQGRLFLLLPHIRQAALNSIAHMFALKSNKEMKDKQLDLLFEMLDARMVVQPEKANVGSDNLPGTESSSELSS